VPRGDGSKGGCPAFDHVLTFGRGLALLLMEAQRRHLPSREGVAFVRSDNAASRAMHARAGYLEVTTFTHAGIGYVVVARKG
jgi:L-amino acid N-acyltransferase YncA